ncbi:hypothetical protein [Flavobacterium sp. KACC 22763]|uniref:hypothetical protein n=1 Tax=Flavobacterium sp. KACC 22763 TaxID=3025668 RepID=UPI002366FE6B|nr:hypothetical protein [Flavobacterium sp. KACC 22763]WDF66073.1 hypothetical protein PQ463_07870 [Flavobacterium sp. KACC 22763]
MLGDVSWKAFVIAATAFLFLWYGYVFFRYYPKNFISILKGGFRRRSLAAEDMKSDSPFAKFKESFSTLEDAEELYSKLLDAFAESDARGVSKTEFKHYLQFVLSEYPFVKQSALREKINSLVISESLKYPEFVLGSLEMDSLWEKQR